MTHGTVPEFSTTVRELVALGITRKELPRKGRLPGSIRSRDNIKVRLPRFSLHVNLFYLSLLWITMRRRTRVSPIQIVAHAAPFGGILMENSLLE